MTAAVVELSASTLEKLRVTLETSGDPTGVPPGFTVAAPSAAPQQWARQPPTPGRPGTAAPVSSGPPVPANITAAVAVAGRATRRRIGQATAASEAAATAARRTPPGRRGRLAAEEATAAPTRAAAARAVRVL